jgi:hypothetical protein
MLFNICLQGGSGGGGEAYPVGEGGGEAYPVGGGEGEAYPGGGDQSQIEGNYEPTGAGGMYTGDASNDHQLMIQFPNGVTD